MNSKNTRLMLVATLVAFPGVGLAQSLEEVIVTAQKREHEDDAVALRIIQENLNREDRSGRLEFGTANDRFGVRMRKILRDLKKKELGDAFRRIDDGIDKSCERDISVWPELCGRLHG